ANFMKMPQTKILLVTLALNGALFAQEVPRDPATENKPTTEPAKQADPAQTNTQTPSSQTPALPDASIQVSLQLVSNSVFRGDDTFKGRAQQKRKQYGTHSGEWMFQPSITFNTPLEGLTFNWVGSFALAGRQDTDVDQRIESGRDGNETTFFDSYYGSIASGSSTAAAFAQARTDLINTFGGVGPVPAATANSFPTRAVRSMRLTKKQTVFADWMKWTGLLDMSARRKLGPWAEAYSCRPCQTPRGKQIHSSVVAVDTYSLNSSSRTPYLNSKI
ncbi:MAG TPA: hypothetical protein PKJ30_16350, partial [Leptospiraceae bacterium]|nr:hypothetical protein [Leptospiraceae bacterium]